MLCVTHCSWWKKVGNWYSYLSGSQSTLKIHVADMKTPLLKFANHIKVCHVAFVKQLFIFISIYAKMKKKKQTTKSIWCSFLRLLFTCGTHNFSHLYKTAVLREWQGRVLLEVIAGSKRLQLEGGRSWKPGGVQVSVLEDTEKNKNNLLAGDWTWQNMIWARRNGLFCLVLIALMK